MKEIVEKREVEELLGCEITDEQLQKPFAIPRVTFSPDYTDPEVRKAMLSQGMNSIGSLFGATPNIVAIPDTLTGGERDEFNPEEFADNPAFASDEAIFYKTLQKLPNKYNNGKLRWLMSPKRAQEWELYLMNQVIGKGGAVPENVYTQPVHIPTVSCPSISDDKIILTDPKNLVVVNTYGMKIRKTTEGKEAIMQDKRFYVCHLDYDPIIEELDATAIITGLPSLD